MSQSNIHVDLIMQIVVKLESHYPKIKLVADIQEKPGDPVPPLIGGFRPDVYAQLSSESPTVIIAEAKTDNDLETNHTYNQLKAFIGHIEQKRNSKFILSVTGCAADRARTLLRLLSLDISTEHAILLVFDSLDLWSLDKTSGETWHLV